jgi:Na+-transporting methylmalonyl-CoA/oxaloacetate decarboxylase gamma subunit
MGNLIGILILLGILAIAAIFVVRAILKAIFRGVSRAAGKAAYHGTKAVKGEEYADKHEETIKEVATAVTAIGGIAIAADVADVGGGEEAFASESANDLSGGFEEAAGDNMTGEGIDLDGDGQIEGFDTDGDGEIDQNIIGVEVPGTENVDGYTTEDGTHVDPYTRSKPDSSTLNNLDPEQ